MDDATESNRLHHFLNVHIFGIKPKPQRWNGAKIIKMMIKFLEFTLAK